MQMGVEVEGSTWRWTFGWLGARIGKGRIICLKFENMEFPVV